MQSWPLNQYYMQADSLALITPFRLVFRTPLNAPWEKPFSVSQKESVITVPHLLKLKKTSKISICSPLLLEPCNVDMSVYTVLQEWQLSQGSNDMS